MVETEARTGKTKWWTFAGLKVNYSLAQVLQTSDGVVPSFDNFSVEIPHAGGVDETERRLQEAASKLDAAQFVDPDSHIKVKFWECLPMPLRRRYLASRLTDSFSAAKCLAALRVYREA